MILSKTLWIMSLCIMKESWDHSIAFLIKDAGIKERMKRSICREIEGTVFTRCN